jgi:hypothetical protein
MKRKKKKTGIEWKILAKPQIVDLMEEAITYGVPMTTACEYADLGYRTYYKYRDMYDDLLIQLESRPNKRLKKHEQAIVQMMHRLKKAEAIFEHNAVQTITKVGLGGNLIKEQKIEHEDGRMEQLKEYAQPNWQALMTTLERKWPERWGRRDKLDIKEEKHIRNEISILSNFTEKELETLVGFLEALGSETVATELQEILDERSQKALIPPDREN